MARGKKQNAPPASSSATKNPTQSNTSQPSKYGVQHFFARYSLSESSRHRETNDAGSVPKPPPPATAVATATVNTTISSLPEDAALTSSKVYRTRLRSKKAESAPEEAQGLNSELKSSNKGTTLGKAEEICQQLVMPPKNSLISSAESDENSPQFLKSTPRKRFKFSPGMLLKQSQDDVADEIAWKISPVYQRLLTISKNKPEKVKALAELSRCVSSDLMQCPKEVEEHLSSSNFKVPGKFDWSLVRPGLQKGIRGQTVNATGSDSDANNVNHSSLLAKNSSFQTPSSLSHCHGKALLELLDQVEDAISLEGSLPNEERVSFQDRPNESSNDKLVTCQPQGHLSTTKLAEEANLTSSSSSFLVLEVTEMCCLENLSGAQYSAKVLRLVDERCGKEKSVHLCNAWTYSVVAPGDTVHVIGDFDEDGKCIVNDERNFIVVQPQQLISCTAVAGSLSCRRRAVLDERLKFSEVSTAALSGTLLHQIFEAGLVMEESSSREALEEYARIVLQKNIERLYSCGVNEDDMLKNLLDSVPKIMSWIDIFKWRKESQMSVVDFEPDSGSKQIGISEVIDIEEMVWAPKYGLKGMIDGSLVVRTESGMNETNETIMPLEFKTGKSALEHDAQVILYTLLMSERYSEDIDTALLFYLQTNKTKGKIARRSDLVWLIMRRNELAHDILKALAIQQLPPMCQNPNMCKGCRHLDNCTAYHKMHGGNSESSGLGEDFDVRTAHLTMSHVSFFRHWDQLIDLEAKEMQFSVGNMWHTNLFKGQSSLSCLRSLVLDASHELHSHNPNRDKKFVYHFMRQDGTGPDMNKNEGSSRNDSSLLWNDMECTLRSGDFVILSIESSCLAVANGVIKDICPSHVSVTFSKRLRIHRGSASSMSNDLHQQVWRLDKDESVNSYAIMRYNLVQLFIRNPESVSMRKKIVDLEVPRFDGGSVLSQDPAISYIWSESNLNDDQRKAIVKILSAKDYALIHGMPGTGKTSTMVYAIKALLMRGASILLTSYTNSAVDNLLIKLKAQGIDFVRLGRPEVVHPEVQDHCISGMAIHSVEEMGRRMLQVKVIGVTCLGITSPLLANRKFDVCIMDEAGQTILPVSLGPLMFASKFVLVGDHYQLPPLVQSAQARENGMGVSLLCRLSEAHPQAVSALRYQYRMSEGIMNLSNALIYGDQMLCGASHVRSSMLRFARSGTITPWLQEVLDEKNSVIFINTDMLPAIEERENKTVHNRLEAFIVIEIVRTLVDNGVKEEDIGVITPYNSQASLIRHAISMKPLEVHTIDKYQGRDKDCILISFVRSTREPSDLSSSLLGDWHRMNVALTRAKKKLIMVGSCKTLSRMPLMKLLIDKVNEQSGILYITKDDIEASGGHERDLSSQMYHEL